MFSPAVRLFHPHDPRLRTETFSVFLGPLLSGGPLFSGFNRKVKKINVTFGEPLFSGEPLLSEFDGIQ